MGNLAEMSDSAKVAFLMEVIEDAAAELRHHSLYALAARYEGYVREMRGEPKEVSHE